MEILKAKKVNHLTAVSHSYVWTGQLMTSQEREWLTG